jgi:hypothetical protein
MLFCFFANNNIVGQHHVAVTCHFIPLWYYHLYYFLQHEYCHFFLLLTTWVLLLLPTSYNEGIIIFFAFCHSVLPLDSWIGCLVTSVHTKQRFEIQKSRLEVHQIHVQQIHSMCMV